MRFSAIFSEHASRRLGVAASALLLCGVTLIGSTGAGMMDRSQANPINHMVERPHHHNHGSSGSSDGSNGSSNGSSHGSNGNNGNNGSNGSNGSNGRNGSNGNNGSSKAPVVLPMTGSDPGSHRLP